MNKPLCACGAVLIACGVAMPQVQPPNPVQQQVVTPVNQGGPMPVFRVTVVSRTTKAVNYRHRGGSTKVDFRGTPLLPQAKGEAKIESKQGYIEIEVEFDELEPATKFGPEYLTYTMWAITPEGRATNLGEVLLNGSESKLNVTTELQSFGLIVTAEPYFAVSQPSDVVVMENFIRGDTEGKIEIVDAKYELLKRGQYTMTASPGQLQARVLDGKTPLELHQARNAVQLARFAGADRYAGDTFTKAENQLREAEDLFTRKKNKRNIIMTARAAVQTAEDSRLIAIQRQEEERLAQERQAAAERERLAAVKAAEEADRRRDAELQAERSARQKAESDAARIAAEHAKAAADAAAKRLAEEKATADAAAQRLAQEKASSEAAAQRLAQEKAEADAARAAAEAARAAALAQQQTAQQEAERSRLAAEQAAAAANQANALAAQAAKERDEMRSRLQQQLNLILETRESARGLIVNMSDVLFDVDKATLKPGAREKLAKVSGILLAYPGLTIQVEGHTDSTGSDSYNQQLSERRAQAVRDYLVSQRIPADTVTARGFGESMPVVTNDTAAGRQQNRRVELVVSGELIGGVSTSASR